MYNYRHYVKNHKKVPIKVLAHNIFRRTVVMHDSVSSRITSILLDIIAVERSGNIIDRDVIRQILTMLVELGIDGKFVSIVIIIIVL